MTTVWLATSGDNAMSQRERGQSRVLFLLRRTSRRKYWKEGREIAG